MWRLEGEMFFSRREREVKELSDEVETRSMENQDPKGNENNLSGKNFLHKPRKAITSLERSSLVEGKAMNPEGAAKQSTGSEMVSELSGLERGVQKFREENSGLIASFTKQDREKNPGKEIRRRRTVLYCGFEAVAKMGAERNWGVENQVAGEKTNEKLLLESCARKFVMIK